ncbi:MAG TPA: TAXI family TRAP transporter solute-binding subunit [Vicinamibacterales bacterium]|jgi:TRAP transporter TAXI family solute receptor|nr:TAXI family TRAP transporter solute-binding subunit [Vicinamibacterales bacterium]
MRWTRVIVGCAVAALASAPRTGSVNAQGAAGRVAQSAPGTVAVTLATATPGGGFPLYGDTLARVLHETDPGLEVRTRNTAGSTENVPLLDRGDVDLALVQGEAAYEAFAGIGRAPTRALVLSAMYSTPGFFAVRADSPYHAIEDLRGRSIAFGARGSGLVILARYVLDGLGLDMNRDFTPVLLDRAGDGPAMVRDGRVAALWGGGTGWPGFTELMSGPGGARLIAPSSIEIARIVAAHPFLKPLTLSAGAYAGQTQPIASVGSWSLILTRPTLSDDVAYRLARALHESERALAAQLPQARETTAANTLAAVPADRIHPGVLTYFREIGLRP